MAVDGSVSAYIVFILLIFCGSFFLMNLFLAAIGIEDEDEDNEERGEDVKGTNPPTNEGDVMVDESAGALKRLVIHKYFDYFITGCILVNTITLSMDHYPVPDAGKDYYPAETEPEAFKAVENINMVLTYVFIIEMALKIPALGPVGYASDPFNLFDAFIVVTSIVEIIMAAVSDSEEGGASGMSALRTFRLFRVFKLAKQWEEMQILLRAMARTSIDIANFAVLLILFMYIMALVGMQFYANEMHFDPDTNFKIDFDDKYERWNSPEVMDNIPRNNFDNLMWSLTTIFQFLSGENWNSIMYDCYRAGGVGGIIYNMVIFIIGAMIVMNLFLAILLSNFEGNDDLIKVDAEAITESTRKLMKSLPEPVAGTPMARRPTAMPDKDVMAFYLLSNRNLFRAKCTRIALDRR